MRASMFQRRILVVSISLIAVVLSIAPYAQTPAPAGPATFVPDWTFKGSALTGTQQVGQATWRAENGEIVGTPTSADGGWLLINPGYQDVLFAGSFRCAAACSAGVMLRTENTSGGTKGIFTSLA